METWLVCLFCVIEIVLVVCFRRQEAIIVLTETAVLTAAFFLKASLEQALLLFLAAFAGYLLIKEHHGRK